MLWRTEAFTKCLTEYLQPWESAAAFGNAVVNAVLCWFYDGEKNAVVRVFTYAVFSGFTVLLIIPERFNLVYN